eukprot:9143113-Pyramimonas_sp.AAC.1
MDHWVAEKLEELLDEERRDERVFKELPYHYYEISQILFQECVALPPQSKTKSRNRNMSYIECTLSPLVSSTDRDGDRTPQGKRRLRWRPTYGE